LTGRKGETTGVNGGFTCRKGETTARRGGETGSRGETRGYIPGVVHSKCDGVFVPAMVSALCVFEPRFHSAHGDPESAFVYVICRVIEPLTSGTLELMS
jgi:hypothetical protein